MSGRLGVTEENSGFLACCLKTCPSPLPVTLQKLCTISSKQWEVERQADEPLCNYRKLHEDRFHLLRACGTRILPFLARLDHLSPLVSQCKFIALPSSSARQLSPFGEYATCSFSVPQAVTSDHANDLRPRQQPRPRHPPHRYRRLPHQAHRPPPASQTPSTCSHTCARSRC